MPILKALTTRRNEINQKVFESFVVGVWLALPIYSGTAYMQTAFQHLGR